MNKQLIGLLALVLGGTLAVFASGSPGLAQAKKAADSDRNLMREVRHELVTIPYLSVFDNLAYSINGSVVTLSGQVLNSAIKESAEHSVKGIDGVTQVIDNIEILPDSPMDDQIRRAVFQAVYGDTSLQRYAQGALLPIRIVVKEGHVTLAGVVANQGDKDLAYIRANGVPGVFSVTNNLSLDSQN